MHRPPRFETIRWLDTLECPVFCQGPRFYYEPLKSVRFGVTREITTSQELLVTAFKWTVNLALRCPEWITNASSCLYKGAQITTNRAFWICQIQTNYLVRACSAFVKFWSPSRTPDQQCRGRRQMCQGSFYMKQIDLVLLLTFWKNQQGLVHLASHCALTVGLPAHAIAEIVTSQLDAELSLGSHFETNQTKNKKSLWSVYTIGLWLVTQKKCLTRSRSPSPTCTLQFGSAKQSLSEKNLAKIAFFSHDCFQELEP